MAVGGNRIGMGCTIRSKMSGIAHGGGPFARPRPSLPHDAVVLLVGGELG